MEKKNSYRGNWNDWLELECFIVARKIQENKNIKSQIQYSRELETKYRKFNIPENSYSAKISNYKSLLGINKASNYSSNSKKIYETFKKFSLDELKKISLDELDLRLELRLKLEELEELKK